MAMCASILVGVFANFGVFFFFLGNNLEAPPCQATDKRLNCEFPMVWQLCE
jgi:hypothetical protein